MNTKITRLTTMIATGGLLLFASCKKDRPVVIDPVPSSTLGMYVLCEGAYGTPTSAITYYDIATNTATPDYFKAQNGRGLGTNATDLKAYGSKMYCVVTGTDKTSKDAYVEVINIATGKSIRQIPFFNDTEGFLPHGIAFHKGKAYVSGYDGYVSKIDTASLNVESRIAVGGALEDITIVNNKLYVTNSAHYLYPNDNNASVSVVDLNTFTKVKDIPVGANPTKISAANNGNVFVAISADYGESMALDRISSATDTKTGSVSGRASGLTIFGDQGFVMGDYMDYYLKTMNTSTGVIGGNFVTDGTVVTTPYSVTVNALNNEVLVSDAKSYAEIGQVTSFTADGKSKYSFSTMSMPKSVVFKYQYK